MRVNMLLRGVAPVEDARTCRILFPTVHIDVSLSDIASLLDLDGGCPSPA
jgi:hypothetical protein